jgi:hypothetical protein
MRQAIRGLHQRAVASGLWIVTLMTDVIGRVRSEAIIRAHQSSLALMREAIGEHSSGDDGGNHRVMTEAIIG